jgi:hypothetical protein
MNADLQALVNSRARDLCEYCRLPQHAVPFATFHVDHIIARQHGGPDEADNLALACDRCNAYKGTNLSAIDPITNTIVRLFNPRTDLWSAHFRQLRFEVEGITETGRATAQLLNMNAPHRVQLRAGLGIQLDSH